MSASEKKIVVVLGATGLQGGSVARALLAHGTCCHVRCLTRSPTSSASRALSSLGAEVVAADFDSPSSLCSAFTNANIIFAVTDFWATGSLSTEVGHGKNIADAASQVSTLETFIFSSLPNLKSASGGKLSGIWHYNAKNEIVSYVREQKEELAAKMTEVWVASYFENWKKHAKAGTLGPRKLDDGEGRFEVALPSRPDTVVPCVFCGELGKLVYEIVEAGAEYRGRTVDFYAEQITDEERMRVWAEETGFTVNFKHIPIEEYQANLLQFLPEHLVQDITERLRFFDEFRTYRRDGDGVLDAKEVLEKKGVALKSWREYVKSEDWSSI